MNEHNSIDVALLATVNLIRGTKPNDRSAIDRHYAVTITMLEQAYAYFHTYVTGDAQPSAPTFEQRHDANKEALQEIASMLGVTDCDAFGRPE